MEDHDKDMVLLTLLENVHAETDKAVKSLEQMRKKASNAVLRAQSVILPDMRGKERDKTITGITKMVERLIDLNVDLELTEDDFPNLAIPYISASDNVVKLKFHSGDSPWSFWLVNNAVDTKAIQKHLLQKYQNDLLEPYPHPKLSESVCFLDRNKVFRGVILQIVNENRLKVVDCDNNISRIVASDKVFKADPDACQAYASVIKCTITKASPCTELWSSYIRDVFCNTLKEASLQVKITERLPCSFPTFLVDVTISNEDKESANLKEWVVDRLLPELKKLPLNESGSGYDDESLCDFVSDEALNPYYKSNAELVKKLDKNSKTGDDNNVPSRRTSESVENNIVSNITEEVVKDNTRRTTNKSLLLGLCTDEEINNLNVVTDKTSVKVVPNVELTENEEPITQSAKDRQTLMSRSEECLVSSSDSVNAGSKDAKEEKLINSHTSKNRDLNCNSEEFSPTPTNTPISATANPYEFNRPVHQQKHIPGSYRPPFLGPPVVFGSGFRHPAPHPLQWAYAGPPLQSVLRHPVPYSHQPPMYWNQQPAAPSISGVQQWPPPENAVDSQAAVGTRPKQWSSGGASNFNQENNNSRMNCSNFNSINVSVNVMAKEFVPNVSSDYKTNEEKTTSSLDNGPSYVPPALPTPKDEIVHYKLRKPNSLLKPRENLLVLISHVNSPDEFYVHLVNKNNKFMDMLIKEMLSHYTTHEKVTFKTWHAAQKSMGKFCACNWHEDNQWYRVEVLDWTPGDNKVKVFFVDYGNTDLVELSSLQPLMKSFTKLSMCAQPCHLAEVFPVNRQPKWPKESVEFFKNLLEVNNQNKANVYSVIVVPSSNKHAVVNSLSVILLEGKGDESSYSINKLMVDQKLAEGRLKKALSSEGSESFYSYSSEELLSTECVEESKKEVLPSPSATLHLGLVDPVMKEDEFGDWDPLTEDFNDVRNNPVLDTDDAGVALVGYKAKDEERICKFYYQNGECWKQNCTKEHSRPSADGVTTDKEESYSKCFSEITLPGMGETVEVMVTCVDSLDLFYIQLHQDRAYGADCDDEEIETLSKLHAFINRPANVNSMKYLVTNPALGQLVLAKYEDQWFRARVCSADELELEVHFVDYGTIYKVSIRDLRRMEPEYLHLPFQAIECSLANIEDATDKTSEGFKKASDQLRELIEGKIMNAKVYYSGETQDEDTPKVWLQQEDGTDVGQLLAFLGHCQLRSV